MYNMKISVLVLSIENRVNLKKNSSNMSKISSDHVVWYVIYETLSPFILLAEVFALMRIDN